MCGIVGIVGNKPVADRLFDALKRLEYRGYDSAGIATYQQGVLDRRRASGKLVELQKVLAVDPIDGNVGIGHTRWATHGAPTIANAHPHQTLSVAIVHNGIIENFKSLKESLLAEGCNFESDTDTEVVAQLVERALKKAGSPQQAFAHVVSQLVGAFSLALIFKDDDDLIIAARKGSPLAIGYGEDENYVGSDAIALAPFTSKLSYLEDGDWAMVRQHSVAIFDAKGVQVEREIRNSGTSGHMVDRGNYRHFMQKEMHEQPEVVGYALAHYFDFGKGSVNEAPFADVDFSKYSRISLMACGTGYFACLIGKYWIEQLSGMPVDIDIASEFRYRNPPLDKNTLALAISQSGETADTLAAIKYCVDHGLDTGCIVNVPECSMIRETNFSFPILAGPEIAVASTKAFTCQLATLVALAIKVAETKKPEIDMSEHISALASLPRLLAETLHLEADIASFAREFSKTKGALFLGRGQNFPLALEGALKLKELSYIHAEGYPAGELKHGPIALVDEDLPIIVIAPMDTIFEKTVSNMQEVAARGGKIILITDNAGSKSAGLETFKTFILPDMNPIAAPIAYALPLQMLAYHTAVFLGTDVDQPRNLAKSVTVE